VRGSSGRSGNPFPAPIGRRFAVSEEGAGIVRIQRDGDSDVLRLDWRVEWVTVAAPGNAARAMAHGEPMPELPGLFA